jgi:hypothetical protein
MRIIDELAHGRRGKCRHQVGGASVSAITPKAGMMLHCGK